MCGKHLIPRRISAVWKKRQQRWRTRLESFQMKRIKGVLKGFRVDSNSRTLQGIFRVVPEEFQDHFQRHFKWFTGFLRAFQWGVRGFGMFRGNSGAFQEIPRFCFYGGISGGYGCSEILQKDGEDFRNIEIP